MTTAFNPTCPYCGSWILLLIDIEHLEDLARTIWRCTVCQLTSHDYIAPIKTDPTPTKRGFRGRKL